MYWDGQRFARLTVWWHYDRCGVTRQAALAVGSVHSHHVGSKGNQATDERPKRGLFTAVHDARAIQKSVVIIGWVKEEIMEVSVYLGILSRY